MIVVGDVVRAAVIWSRRARSLGGQLLIAMQSGETHASEVRYPAGHEKNPMSDRDIERKFNELAAERLERAQCEQLLGTLWQLDRVTDVRTLTALVSGKGEHVG